ncbi:MAG: FkbM family methyltransferase [Acidobacteriota bacterium]
MKVLFILKQMGYVRHFTEVVRTLSAHGHTVRLASQDGDHNLPPSLSGLPNVTTLMCGSKRGDEWQEYISLLRRTLDYLRYLTPPFAGATKLRARAFDKLVSTLSGGARVVPTGSADLALGLTPVEQDRLRGFFSLLLRQIPPDAALQRFLKSEAPDVVLVTPLVDLGSSQADYVKAARELGIPCAMVLFSWDNLTTKGLVHAIPDRVFVWNDLQAREAEELHGVPRKLIVPTGAPRFDDFFRMSASIDRESFCRLLGLDPAMPIVVFLGSSKFVAENERPFVQRWIEAVRSTPGLSHVNIIVKPHPDVHRTWDGDDQRVAWSAADGEVRLRLSKPFPQERVVVTRAPFSAAQYLYDCLYHSSAVVGLNTSAELEAAILGRPVLTIRAPEEYADGQEGTLHFHYLLKEHGGFVQSSTTLPQHCAQLEQSLTGNFDREGMQRFVESFLRPAGLAAPASDVLVRSIERMHKRAKKRAEEAKATDAVEAEQARAAAEARAAQEAAESNRVEAVVELDYKPVRIIIRGTSNEERLWRARSCWKEPWTVEWLERNIREGSVLYDIGANVGTFTLIAACRQPAATVVAFEPGYASYAHLCENLVLNGCTRNVIPVPLPLWSDSTLLGMRYRSLAPGQSRHTLRAGAPASGACADGRYDQPMFGVKLDDLVRQYGLPQPTAIKLDVDGAEQEVLAGAAGVIRNASLETMLVEFDASVGDSVRETLAAAGFSSVSVISRDKPGAPAYAEFRRGCSPAHRTALEDA